MGGTSISRANPAQQEAILSYTGETLVLAGPGSGKTFVLTAHIETLIAHYHVDPSSILVLTFSKAAALSMRSRFYKNTQGRYPPISFGTFHSIFYQIIRRGGDDKAVLIDPARRRRLLQELLQQYFPELSGPDDVDTVSEIICRSREQGRPCPKGDCKRPEAIAHAVRSYETYLRENHLIDYDGMILLCRDMLRSDPELLQSVRDQYAFILVDEFQDISASQYDILRMLYGPSPEDGHSAGPPASCVHVNEPHKSRHAARALFVVGDDDQSIYGFRGSDPSICREFLRDYPSARQIFLSVNYRSVPPIVQTAGRVIEQNKNRIAKTIVSGKPHTPAKHVQPQGASSKAVVCKAFRDRKEQTGYLVKVITTMDERTRKESAVVFRTNRQLTLFRQELARAGLLPYELSVPENPWIRRVHLLYQGYLAFGIEVRQDCIHKRTYERIMNVPERFLLRESMPRDTMRRAEFLGTYPGDTAAWNAMNTLLHDAVQLCDLPPYMRVRFFRNVIGIEQDLVQRSNGNEEMCRLIREAFDDLADNPNVIYDEEPAGTSQERSRRCAPAADGIALLTMHACKGLEYTNVYLPDLNEGMIPTRKAHTPDAIEEERRLFYVAMTRAKEHLEMLYVQGTAENPETPTRFLLPLGIGPRYSE